MRFQTKGGVRFELRIGLLTLKALLGAFFLVLFEGHGIGKTRAAFSCAVVPLWRMFVS